jgi:hypothetical protein
MIPMAIMQLEAIEAILKSNSILTEEKKKQIDSFREQLTRLSQGLTLGLYEIRRKQCNCLMIRFGLRFESNEDTQKDEDPNSFYWIFA